MIEVQYSAAMVELGNRSVIFSGLMPIRSETARVNDDIRKIYLDFELPHETKQFDITTGSHYVYVYKDETGMVQTELRDQYDTGSYVCEQIQSEKIVEISQADHVAFEKSYYLGPTYRGWLFGAAFCRCFNILPEDHPGCESVIEQLMESNTDQAKPLLYKYFIVGDEPATTKEN